MLLTFLDLPNEIIYMICLNLDGETYHYLVEAGMGQVLTSKDRLKKGLYYKSISLYNTTPTTKYDNVLFKEITTDIISINYEEGTCEFGIFNDNYMYYCHIIDKSFYDIINDESTTEIELEGDDYEKRSWEMELFNKFGIEY